MKTYNLSVLGLISALASGAFARPGSRVFDGADPIPEQQRMTAFVVKDGELVVECWEIGALLPGTEQQTARQHSSKRTPRVVQMGTSNPYEGLRGVDILTWPDPGNLYGSTTGMHSRALDLGDSPSSFTITRGLVVARAPNVVAAAGAADPDQYFFDSDNGDNWFYFEDTSSSDLRANRDSQPLTLTSVSGGETTLIRFKYNGRPDHNVLHTGRCHFAGLKPADAGAVDKDLELSSLTVQEL